MKVKIYRAIILHVLHMCEICSLTRDEQRLKVFVNRVLRKIFGGKSTEVTAEWRRLHNNELYKIYSSPNFTAIIKSGILRFAGHVARMGERSGAYRVLVGRPHAKRTLGITRRRWEDSIKIGLLELGWESLNSTDLAQGRDMWGVSFEYVMNARVS